MAQQSQIIIWIIFSRHPHHKINGAHAGLTMHCTTLWRNSPLFLYVPFILPVNVALPLLLACTYSMWTGPVMIAMVTLEVLSFTWPSLYKCLYVCIKEWTKYLYNLYRIPLYYILCYFVLYLFLHKNNYNDLLFIS